MNQSLVVPVAPPDGDQLQYAPLFQLSEELPHGLQAWVAVDETGTVAVWYYLAAKDTTRGPFCGARTDDLVTSIRALGILHEVMPKFSAFTEAILVPCCHLADPACPLDSDEAKPANRHLDADTRSQILAAPLPILDEALAYLVGCDVEVAVLPIYDALRKETLPWTEVAATLVTNGLLLVYGSLTAEYQQAMYRVQQQRPGADSKLVNLYIDAVEDLLNEILTSMEKIFKRAVAKIPKEPPPEQSPARRPLLQTITACFKRKDLVTSDANRPTIYKSTGVDRIAATEAISDLKDMLWGDKPYEEMKFPQYHNALHKLAQGIHNLSRRLDDTALKCGDELAGACTGAASDLRALLSYLNMSIRERLPDAYELDLTR